MKPLDSSDAEIQALEALCNRLAGFEEGISLEWLDGCMAALLSGPRSIAFNEWLPKLLGDVWERTFADPQDVQQAMHTLRARWNVLASQLDPEALFDAPDELRLAPLLDDYSPEVRDKLIADGHPDADDTHSWPLTGEIWAIGVMQTIETFAGDWVIPDRSRDDTAWVQGCVKAVLALTLQDPAALEADLKLRYPGRPLSRDELIDEACFAVQDLRCYWIEHAPRHAPRKVPAAPGRNDPCPCGSGKKFKKCHGAATALS